MTYETIAQGSEFETERHAPMAVKSSEIHLPLTGSSLQWSKRREGARRLETRPTTEQLQLPYEVAAERNRQRSARWEVNAHSWRKRVWQDFDIFASDSWSVTQTQEWNWGRYFSQDQKRERGLHVLECDVSPVWSKEAPNSRDRTSEGSNRYLKDKGADQSSLQDSPPPRHKWPIPIQPCHFIPTDELPNCRVHHPWQGSCR